jgi:hypothetical protein
VTAEAKQSCALCLDGQHERCSRSSLCSCACGGGEIPDYCRGRCGREVARSGAVCDTCDGRAASSLLAAARAVRRALTVAEARGALTVMNDLAGISDTLDRAARGLRRRA